MKKLKLENLDVTSFETSATPLEARGTVVGAARTTLPGCSGPLATYSLEQCGDTQYFDCTLACSHLTYCQTCNGLTVDLNC